MSRAGTPEGTHDEHREDVDPTHEEGPTGSSSSTGLSLSATDVKNIAEAVVSFLKPPSSTTPIAASHGTPPARTAPGTCTEGLLARTHAYSPIQVKGRVIHIFTVFARVEAAATINFS